MWSVVQTESDSGYAADVTPCLSRAEAVREARDLGGAFIVKGTQCWNEPVGQTEESDHAPVRWIGAKR